MIIGLFAVISANAFAVDVENCTAVTGNNYYRLISNQTNGCILGTGFSVANANNSDVDCNNHLINGSIQFWGSNITLRNCEINIPVDGYMIQMADIGSNSAYDMTLKDNYISGNTLLPFISIRSAYNTIINNNTFGEVLDGEGRIILAGDGMSSPVNISILGNNWNSGNIPSNSNGLFIQGNNFNTTSISGTATGVTFFNNFVNKSASFNAINATLNTTLQLGSNIVNGGYMGGNYWAGFSNNRTLCTPNSNKICLNTYTLNGTYTDYLPLTTLEINDILIFNVTNTTYPAGNVYISATTDTVSGCSYSIDNSDYTALQTQNNLTHNFTAAFIAGEYQLNVTCVDSNLFSGSDYVSFTVEAPPPEPRFTYEGSDIPLITGDVIGTSLAESKQYVPAILIMLLLVAVYLAVKYIQVISGD